MKDTTNAKVVTHSIELDLVDPQGDATSIEADLIFDPADPYAVTMVFRTGEQEVLWTFGRELLLEGRYEPAGDGDVHVWPCLSSEGKAVVIVELCSPQGEVLVQTATRNVDHFVAAMLTSVPDGQESAFVDFDDELAAVLSD
jgi:hypothetical protein